MRGILVDWVIEVHLRFKLLPETLFLTVNLIDRYCEKQQVHRTRLQLVAVAAMLIASKYEEIYAPMVRDFVYITDNAYTREEILEMEGRMLTEFEFDITNPTSYRFLERFAQVCDTPTQLWYLAQYLIELPLIEQRMLSYTPSNIAASALYLARKILMRKEGHWTAELQRHTGYTEEQLRSCAKDMCILITCIEKCSLQAVRKKFSTKKFHEVALIKIEN